MKNYIQPGDMLTVTAPANVASGAGVLIGSIFGVAANAALSGASMEMAVEGVPARLREFSVVARAAAMADHVDTRECLVRGGEAEIRIRRFEDEVGEVRRV